MSARARTGRRLAALPWRLPVTGTLAASLVAAAMLAPAWLALLSHPAPRAEPTPAVGGRVQAPAPLASPAPAPPLEEACRAGSLGLPASAWLGARRVYEATNRSVDMDVRTALRALGLARALNQTLTLDDVLSYEEERVEACLLREVGELPPEDLLPVLALAGPVAPGAFRADLRLLVVTRTHVAHEVSLDREEFLALAALARLLPQVDLRDALDVRHEERASLVEARLVDVDLDLAPGGRGWKGAPAGPEALALSGDAP